MAVPVQSVAARTLAHAARFTLGRFALLRRALAHLALMLGHARSAAARTLAHVFQVTLVRLALTHRAQARLALIVEPVW